ncbi:MAG: peptidoglycan DD-metalloendopeptidase family protein [Gammaproteobacteria bacterium]|nr:peptidoglycan DD-metalloendopeptidase family protein [Gammaproteobacteria bacterium]
MTPAKLTLLILISLLFSMKINAGNESDDMNKQLQAVNTQINRVQTNLSVDQVSQNKLQKELQGMEVTIGQVTANLHSLNKQIKLEMTKFSLLQAQQRIYQQQLDQQQEALSNQIRSAYFMGQQNYLKLLLNQQNPTDITRNMTYFQYLNKNRLVLINSLNSTLHQLFSNQEKIEQQASALKLLRKQQQDQQSQLLRAKQVRVALLTRLDQQINTNQAQLGALQDNKKNLQHLMEQLQREANNNMLSMPVPFSQLKGRLKWPTHGAIVLHYNTPIEGSDLNSNGVIIKAPEGQNVYAIYPGRVMFAGWLKGFGLLMIVDHGNGYMSLYGRNQSLFKKTGQAVNAGELLAQVGETGGYDQSGLYFEIRYDGEPVNPEVWCQ